MSEQQIQEYSDKAGYRSIFKGTSLFGGVQVYQILIGIIKSKLIAVLLGPAGMGIQGLYQSAIQLIQSITSLGLSQSAVRDISEAHGSGDSYIVAKKIAVLRKLVWFTGLLGLIATACFSPLLSKTAFGNYDYTLPFIFLSIILFFDQLSAGQKVVLQGLRKLKFLAKATALGSTVGLIISVPFYYVLGVRGIVPTLILNSFTALLLSWFFSKKIKIEKVPVTSSDVIREGQSMLKMGIAMSMNSALSAGVAYVLRSFIRYDGGEAEVGLFMAGYFIMTYYTGLVFNAMGTDYYPRLAAVNKDNKQCRLIINQQGEIALLIMTPLMLVCMMFMPYVIRILYSKDFLAANGYILWTTIGMLFKVSSWAISYVFIAKGEAVLYVLNELIGNIVFLALYLLGYRLGGISGLGMAFSIGYLYYLLQVYVIAFKRYKFQFTGRYLFVFSIQMFFIVSVFILTISWHSAFVYVPTSILLVLCIMFSFKELDNRIDIKGILLNRIKK